LLGIFWGAPLLARELETGTYRLAWTQSVSRHRWVVTKLAIGAAGTATIAGLLTLTITWWNRSLDRVGADRFATFDRRDIVPIGYALFAFATGALIGAVLRRTVPAMAVTLGLFVLARVSLALWVRPHLLPPLHKTMTLGNVGPTSHVQFDVGSRNGGALTLFAQGEGPRGSWTLSSHLVNASGKTPTSGQIAAFLHHYCPNVGLPPTAHSAGQGVARVAGQDAGRTCLAQATKAFHLVVAYHPADRYWTLQWLEAGICLALALAAAVGCYWWITRRAY
jgi:hypothetical protein